MLTSTPSMRLAATPWLIAAIAALGTAPAYAVDYNNGGTNTVNTGMVSGDTVSNGSTLVVEGAAVFSEATALDTSTLRLNGGMHSDGDAYADDSSRFEFLAGDFTEDLEVYANYNSGSEAQISIEGGSAGDDFDIYSSRSLSISGGEFPETEVYAGYYHPNSDAISAEFSGGTHDSFYLYTGTDVGAAPVITANITGGTYTYAELYPGYYDDPTPTINISGGDWGEFYIYNGGDDGLTDATVNITGGTFGYTEVYPGYYDDDATLNLDGGTFNDEFYAYTGGDGPSVPELAINVSGTTFNGVVGFDLGYYGDGTDLTITGGLFNEAVTIDTDYDSIVTLAGGVFNSDLTVNASGQSEVHVYGGQLGTSYGITEDAMVTFYGTEFFVNGMPVSFGTLDLATFGAEARLSGTLADGSTFSDGLLTDNGQGSFELVFQSGIVPEPGSLALLLAVAACTSATSRKS